MRRKLAIGASIAALGVLGVLCWRMIRNRAHAATTAGNAARIEHTPPSTAGALQGATPAIKPAALPPKVKVAIDESATDATARACVDKFRTFVREAALTPEQEARLLVAFHDTKQNFEAIQKDAAQERHDIYSANDRVDRDGTRWVSPEQMAARRELEKGGDVLTRSVPVLGRDLYDRVGVFLTPQQQRHFYNTFDKTAAVWIAVGMPFQATE